MSKSAALALDPSDAAVVAAVAEIKSRKSRAKVKFGGVTVVAPKPSSAQVRQNVHASTMALERAAKRLMRPGVRLYAKKGVPLYSADPDRPGVFVRVLDGKTERGVLENGAFKVTG